jgi:glycosyltransferase involved in cell wall biosynthesis
LDVVGSFDDPRIRVLLFENRGLAHNFNRCVRLARGRFMKVVPHDDLLHPEHLAELVALTLQSDDPAIAFCRREVIYDDGDPWSCQWYQDLSLLEGPLEPLKPVNAGADVLRRWMEADLLRRNCIGEPVATLFHTELARSVGGFSPIMLQDLDFALWIRLMARGDVCYTPQYLCTFRLHDGGASRRHISTNCLVYENLMLFEELASDPSVRAILPELDQLIRRELNRHFGAPWKRRLFFWQQFESLGERPAPPPPSETRLEDFHLEPIAPSPEPRDSNAR